MLFWLKLSIVVTAVIANGILMALAELAEKRAIEVKRRRRKDPSRRRSMEKVMINVMGEVEVMADVMEEVDAIADVMEEVEAVAEGWLKAARLKEMVQEKRKSLRLWRREKRWRQVVEESLWRRWKEKEARRKRVRATLRLAGLPPIFKSR